MQYSYCTWVCERGTIFPIEGVRVTFSVEKGLDRVKGFMLLWSLIVSDISSCLRGLQLSYYQASQCILALLF